MCLVQVSALTGSSVIGLLWSVSGDQLIILWTSRPSFYGLVSVSSAYRCFGGVVTKFCRQPVGYFTDLLVCPCSDLCFHGVVSYWLVVDYFR